MGIITSTSSLLENAQNIILAKSRFTAEHEAPCWELCEKFTLPQGAKQVTVPKVNQFSMSALTEGIDMTDAQDIVMTTTDLTCSEVGAKVILTDKMVRQQNDDAWGMVGRQLGDGWGRKRNRDVIALFSSFSEGFGADNKSLILSNAAACVANMRGAKAPRPMAVVHHPSAIGALVINMVGAGVTYYPGIISGYQEDRLRNFWKAVIDQVSCFETGDIDKIAGYDSGYGAIFSKSAIAVIESKAMGTETERDASLRANELVIVGDYGCYELDDGYGRYMQYEIGTMTTTN